MDCIVRGVTESDVTEQLSLHLWSYTSPTDHNRGDCSYLHLSYYMPVSLSPKLWGQTTGRTKEVPLCSTKTSLNIALCF